MDVLPETTPIDTGRPTLEEELSRIALELHEARDSGETVGRIAESARTALGADDAGVMLVHSRSRVETAAATSPRVARAHDLQVELDEGPCLDALDEREHVLRVDDTRAEVERWPAWCAAVADLGIRSVLSVPLVTHQRLYGSLTVHSGTAHAFGPDDEAVGAVLARHASVALAASRDIEGLRRAVDARKLIGMALGMLMERYDLDDQRAFDVLRRYSQDGNVKLRDLAARVVSDRSLPIEPTAS